MPKLKMTTQLAGRHVVSFGPRRGPYTTLVFDDNCPNPIHRLSTPSRGPAIDAHNQVCKRIISGQLGADGS